MSLSKKLSTDSRNVATLLGDLASVHKSILLERNRYRGLANPGYVLKPYLKKKIHTQRKSKKTKKQKTKTKSKKKPHMDF